MAVVYERRILLLNKASGTIRLFAESLDPGGRYIEWDLALKLWQGGTKGKQQLEQCDWASIGGGRSDGCKPFWLIVWNGKGWDGGHYDATQKKKA